MAILVDTTKVYDVEMLERSTFFGFIIGSIFLAIRLLNAYALEKRLLYQILKHLVTVVIEVMMVQKYFRVDDELKKISYRDLRTRISIFLNRSIILKTVVVISIVAIASNTLTNYTKELLDRYEWFRSIRYRELLLEIVITTVLNILFVNALKYQWAYIDVREININMIIFAWFSISVMLYVIGNRVTCRANK
jgi:hypothetical protein